MEIWVVSLPLGNGAHLIQSIQGRLKGLGDQGFRYSIVRAYWLDGRLIGEATIGQTKEWRRKYGKYVRVIVLKDKVHPVTKAEFDSFYGD